TVVSTGNTATVNVPTGTAGTFVYDLVSVQDASSTTCSQAQYGSVTGTVHSLPSATITSTDGVTLVVSEEATSYLWINCSTDESIDGATSATYAVIENGEYGVQITNENNCINESECFYVTTVGFTENTRAEPLVSLFPNPTKESVTIELTEINKTS